MSTQSSPGSVQQAPPTSNLAIISLVAGVLGFTLFPVAGSIIAVITGYLARKEIQESAGTLGGDGLALAGLILGWVGVGLAVLGFCIFGAFLAIPACAIFFENVRQGAGILMLSGLI